MVEKCRRKAEAAGYCLPCLRKNGPEAMMNDLECSLIWIVAFGRLLMTGAHCFTCRYYLRAGTRCMCQVMAEDGPEPEGEPFFFWHRVDHAQWHPADFSLSQVLHVIKLARGETG